MLRNSVRLLLALDAVSALGAAGCKAKPAPPSGFLQQPEKMDEPGDLPFHRAWYDRHADWDKFTEIYIAPVNVDYLSDEARLVDGGTKQVIAMFADREQGKEALISAKDVTWYGHAYGIVDDWADQAVEIANTPEGGEVSDTSPITLKPW